MVKQYPAVMSAEVWSDSTVVNGEIIPGSPVVTNYTCRYRPNTSAKSVRTADGNTVIYRGTCYVPGTVQVKNGDMVSVPGFIDTPVPILQFYPAQMRNRIIL